MAKKTKTIRGKRDLVAESRRDRANERQRKRLGLKKPPREVSLGKLQPYWEDRDAKIIAAKREDIRRRKKLARRVEKFAEILKDDFGRRIKVVMYLTEEADELCVLTFFKPKKYQHSFAGDSAVQAAFKKSKLDELMRLAGTGTLLKTMERDHHFIEIKTSPHRKKVAGG